MDPPPDIKLWRRRYQRLLRLYPAAYRRHYAQPILQLFDDLVRDAPPGTESRTIRAAMLDTIASIVREQLLSLKQSLTRKETSMSKRPFYVRHRLALSITTAVIIVAAALSAHTVFAAVTSTVRLARINAIYDSLHLSNDYILTSSDVFGDKRVYSWDKGRTWSSSKTYSHDADVDKTVAQLRQKIEAAGFKYFEEPYPGSAQIELHFKSPDRHYIRMTVSSAHRDAAARSGDMNLLAIYDQTHSPKEAPSDVIIKVNLDDNNE
jgi:hypothetical protein